jgi:hypothetical protein
VWFRDYPEPSVPPDDNGYAVRFSGELSGGSSGSQNCQLELLYVPDIGPFNPSLINRFDFSMNNRAELTSNWDWEWHTNSTYTNLLTNGRQHEITSFGDPATTATYWLRAKRQSTSTWTNVGAVNWTDPRNA